MKTKISLLLIFSLLIFSNIEAKVGDEVKGYIIENNGKKVDGKIKIGDLTDNEVKIVFIKSGKKQSYKPSDIQGYGYVDQFLNDVGKMEDVWFHYETKKVDRPPRIFGPTTVFVHKEVEGDINLFCYYIENRTDVSNPYIYHFYVETADGQFLKVDKDNYKEMSKKLFKDYTALVKRLGEKDFRFTNFDRMVFDFNYWAENKHNAEEYRVAMKK